MRLFLDFREVFIQPVILKPRPRIHFCALSEAPTWAVPDLFPSLQAQRHQIEDT